MPVRWLCYWIRLHRQPKDNQRNQYFIAAHISNRRNLHSNKLIDSVSTAWYAMHNRKRTNENRNKKGETASIARVCSRMKRGKNEMLWSDIAMVIHSCNMNIAQANCYVLGFFLQAKLKMKTKEKKKRPQSNKEPKWKNALKLADGLINLFGFTVYANTFAFAFSSFLLFFPPFLILFMFFYANHRIYMCVVCV